MKKNLRWLGINVILLAIYLSFFHLCLNAKPSSCIIFGFAFSALTVLVCFFSRKNFINKYEYAIYHFLAVDILIEGFIPLHEGYMFYGCAAAFWLVFTVYHFTCLKKSKACS